MTIALVPVKHLSAGKSRLLPQLGRAELEALSIAMLEDILEAMEVSTSIDHRVVVTPDVTVAQHATAMGASALLRPDPGLNESIDNATRDLEIDPETPLLVVLGDVAGARPNDFDALDESLEADLGGRGVVLAPSRDGGTSALLRAPAGVIPSAFGPDSAKRHREIAARANVPYCELSLPSLAIDLDRAEDVDEFLAGDSGGRRTRELLAGFDWPGRKRRNA